MGLSFNYFLVAVLICIVGILSGCASSVIPKIEAADAAAEVEVDATLEFTIKRLCRLPVDVIGRATEDADKARAVFYACPEVRALTLNTLRAVGTDSFNVDVTVGVPE